MPAADLHPLIGILPLASPLFVFPISLVGKGNASVSMFSLFAVVAEVMRLCLRTQTAERNDGGLYELVDRKV